MSIAAQPSVRDDGWAEFLSGAKRQSNVILALIFKEYKSRLGRSRLGLLWLILGPLAQISLLAVIWTFIGRSKIEGVPTMLFFAMGYVPYLCIRRCLSAVPGGIRNNQQLLDYPQVKPIDPLIARFIVEFSLLAVAVCLLFFILWWFFDLVPAMPHPLELAYVLAVALTMGFGLALIFGVYGTLYEGLQRAADLMTRPLIWVSCVIHPISILPNSAIEYLKWNPILQFVQHARQYGLGTPSFEQADLVTPSILAAAALGVGILAYYANRYALVQR